MRCSPTSGASQNEHAPVSGPQEYLEAALTPLSFTWKLGAHVRSLLLQEQILRQAVLGHAGAL